VQGSILLQKQWQKPSFFPATGSDINIGKKFLTVVFPDGLRNVRCDGQGQPKPDDMNSNKNI